jgi:hypothetical protein
MRTKDDALRKCPTCDQELGHSIGLRDYSTWLFDVLPGRVSATDLDFVLEQHSSGRFLVMEYKPSKYVPRGQWITLTALAGLPGFAVFVVVDADPEHLSVGRVIKDGPIKWVGMTTNELRAFVRFWWEDELDQLESESPQ